jgi:type II secretory pathway component PulM
MMQFWSSRSHRERLLIGAAGVIAVLLFFSTSVVRPLRAAHADASAKLVEAASTMELVERAVQTKQTGASVRGDWSDAQLRTALVELAANRAIEISRLQTRDDGNIIFQIESVAAPLVFAWLIEAEQKLGVEPVRASMSQDGSGTVRVSVEFDGGQP